MKVGPDSQHFHSPDLAVVAENPTFIEQAHGLAARLGLPVSRATDPAGFDLLLEVGARGLTLAPTDPRRGGGIRIDFVQGATASRRLSGTTSRQPLAKAVAAGKGKPTVVDAAAGLGRDAFQLASLGCTVVALERSPVLAAMLQDAWNRAHANGDQKLRAVMSQLSFIHGDSREVLASFPRKDRPDIVYMDPMYTPRQASALAKKEMRILRMLVGGDEDAVDLLEVSRRTALKKVVVKRHLRAAPLAPGVSHSYRGRAVRYDVYPAFPGT